MSDMLRNPVVAVIGLLFGLLVLWFGRGLEQEEKDTDWSLSWFYLLLQGFGIIVALYFGVRFVRWAW